MGEIKYLDHKWDKLLSCDRTSEFKVTKGMRYYGFMNPWEEDYQQITTSYEFRRLKDKTQVFPLEKNDFVRDRLTHSIEVSGIAKQIFFIAIKNIKKNGFQIKDDFVNASSLLACSGLLHDIGNPPFGHSGEKAIRNWFLNKFNDPTFTFNGKKIEKLFDDSEFGDYKVYKTDLENFEGNAQAIRILLREGSPFNVTESLVASLIKYPNRSLSFDSDSDKVYKHKIGYYESEREKVEKILDGMDLINKDSGEYYRHPLCYILEAADDIAYLTADLEDGIKKKIISVKDIIQDLEDKIILEANNNLDERKDYEQVKKVLSEYKRYDKSRPQNEKNLYQLSLTNNLLDDLKEMIRKSENEIETFDEWIGIVRRWLIYCAGYAFSYRVNEIVNNNEYHELLSREDVFHKYTHRFLREIEQKHLFPETTILEIQGEKIIDSLLELFIPAVVNYDTPNKQTALEQKVISLISNSCIDSYRRVANNPGVDDVTKLYYRFLMVTDYISGMTDNYAKELYKQINGLE